MQISSRRHCANHNRFGVSHQAPFPRSGKHAQCDFKWNMVFSEGPGNCLGAMERAVRLNGIDEDGGKTVHSSFHDRPFAFCQVILWPGTLITYSSNVTPAVSAQIV